MRLYAITRPDFPEDQSSIIVSANGREQAKRIAEPELRGYPDQYIIEPLPQNLQRLQSKIIWREPFGRGGRK